MKNEIFPWKHCAEKTKDRYLAAMCKNNKFTFSVETLTHFMLDINLKKNEKNDIINRILQVFLKD